ncbi:glycoside hydrolase/phage tail family protein [Rhodobacter sp. KR11]|uniref:baseplate multidomain protein megatron n=1 Tax=Rhodobacter sp. KR11 TaxID=2974588 RepID=UPI002222659F|nr:glycoside hydrolase/phage tail family protein [Rhodobacter sp. KR11]MCW1918021.1 glycoside hydrolase/phage tail family protein [Rhodobacter sp. KR11]
MATILLSAAGAALGSGFGGTVLGLSGAVIGRAVGATLGQAIDQRILGAGAAPVDQGRIQRFPLTSASEGAPIPRVWGRMRVSGEVIWATRFLETANRTQGGKGSPRPVTTNYSYTISLAIALCQGEARRLGRVWADGMEIAKGSLDLRFYPGSEDQLPDPKIEAVEGPGQAPAYRGIAYVVIEDLDLSRFGNRVPQFTFEIFRAAGVEGADLADVVEGVALIPGSGEYALATTGVTFNDGPGVSHVVNVHSLEDRTDLAQSLEQLTEELPRVASVSLVTSWFGDDLRCNLCELRPKVDQNSSDGVEMPWYVAGQTRGTAQVLPSVDGKVIYGGTPTDQSVIEAIHAIHVSGKAVMFYPFILMTQTVGNTLADPWSDATTQPILPWRGRITLSEAPGRPGSPDRTATAAAEVAAFMGTTNPALFNLTSGRVVYNGPDDWGYRRFILHYANVCALAGGVEAFCIGSELRGLTQIRGAGDSFPFVQALRTLAAEVRAILGPSVKISYAADWSEYGTHEADGNLYFPLDPLWADANINFVGIDNYMSLSDWRDGTDHLDASWGSIYNLDYLKANVAGGENFDWFYASDVTAAAQLRQPITDGAYNEPWVFRRKDLEGWWSHAHHPRLAGVRQGTPTAWVPGSKPIWFTEYGCAAMDKATNQPNLFLDAYSSESALPRGSNGRRDDLIQLQYLRAMRDYWQDPAHNPMASLYAGRMLDMSRAHVWAWDARPYPAFPANNDVWSDGVNYAHGHWLNGRTGAQPLSAVVSDICASAGLVSGIDSSAAYGLVRGYIVGDTGTARQALQPLTTAYGLNIAEREGVLRFSLRSGVASTEIDRATLAITSDLDSGIEATRGGELETPGRVRLSYVEAEGDYETRGTEAIFPDETSAAVSGSELALQLTNAEARAIAERWLVEARVARDGLRLALPRSKLALGAGDLIKVDGQSYRIDKVEQGAQLQLEAVRVDQGAYQPAEEVDQIVSRAAVRQAATQVFPLFMDLPLLTGSEDPVAPHVAATVSPWSGSIAVWSSASADGFALNSELDAPAVLGLTMTDLPLAPSGLWDNGPALRVKLSSGTLSSASEDDVLNGVNVAAIGDGTAGNWEIIQFQQANLVAPRTYDIRFRLRGQAGSDGVAPDHWPAGSYFVMLDGAVPQIDLPLSARGLTRNYRVGALERGYADAKVVSRSLAFDGNGLRPYSVAHLQATGSLGGTVQLDWIRRTRIDGDSWQSLEVPLGEESELYQVTVSQGSNILRQEVVTLPSWTYTPAMQAEDGAPGPRSVSVAQVSNRYGPGPAQRVDL